MTDITINMRIRYRKENNYIFFAIQFHRILRNIFIKKVYQVSHLKESGVHYNPVK